MLSIVHSAGLIGIHAYPLQVEVDICSRSFPKWHTVGLPENEVKESKERVVAAIKNSGYDFTKRKITINLAPADVKKEGTAFDLPIALGLMGASELVPLETLQSFMILGELSLNGDLRPVKGVLPVAILAKKQGLGKLILPKMNESEAAIVEGLEVYGAKNLSEVVEFLTNNATIKPTPMPVYSPKAIASYGIDYDEIAGQHQAKRALEVAASGGHNILFMGPPGSGKTMLASRLPTILPPLSFEESLETSRVYSVVDLMKNRNALLSERPFRSPHHSISDAGLIGGGSVPRPGEVSLAHNGVLFLDELPEFKKHVLELLRQPLEAGEVTISRASSSLTYPADFMLVSAMNPCPCGYLGHPRVPCRCGILQAQKYRSKLSGPLLDRIDLQIDVPPVRFEEIGNQDPVRENSHVIRERVIRTRMIQRERFKGGMLNSRMTPRMTREHCRLSSESSTLMKNMMEKFHLSARTFDRILKVSRTIADMGECSQVQTAHLLEAVQYRCLDRAGF